MGIPDIPPPLLPLEEVLSVPPRPTPRTPSEALPRHPLLLPAFPHRLSPDPPLLPHFLDPPRLAFRALPPPLPSPNPPTATPTPPLDHLTQDSTQVTSTTVQISIVLSFPP